MPFSFTNLLALWWNVVFFFCYLGIGLIIAKATAKKNNEINYLQTAFIIGFFIRFGFAYGITNIYPPADDAAYYNATGRELARSWTTGTSYYERTPMFFSYIVAGLYVIPGSNLFTVLMFNSFIGALIPIILFDIARRLYNNDDITKLALWFAALSPDLIYRSGFLLKDILVTFLCLLMVWAFSRPRQKIATSFLIFTSSFMLLYKLRDRYAFIILFLGIIYVISQATFIRKYSVYRDVIMLLGLLCFFVYSERFPRVFWGVGIRWSEDYLEGFWQSSATMTHFLPGGRENPLSWGNVIVAIVNSFYSPLPTRFIVAPSLTTVMELPRIFFWYFMMPFWIGGLILIYHRKHLRSCLIYAPALVIFIVSSVAQLGGPTEPVRYRLPAIPFFIILAAYGYFNYRTNKRFRIKINRLIFAFICGIVFLCGLYIYIR
jgi:hypothetical protein